jgi:hypothetical protein
MEAPQNTPAHEPGAERGERIATGDAIAKGGKTSK